MLSEITEVGQRVLIRHKNRTARFLLPVSADETRRCAKWTIAAKGFSYKASSTLGGEYNSEPV